MLRFEIQCISLERYTILEGVRTGGSGRKLYSFLSRALVEVQVRAYGFLESIFFFGGLGVGGMERFPRNGCHLFLMKSSSIS